MAKRTTRRSISVKGLTYQRLKKYVAEYNSTRPKELHLTMSGFVEELVLAKLTELGVPEETVLLPRPQKPQTSDNFVSAHFTF